MCMKACAHVLCVCVPVAMGVQVLPYFSSNGRPLGSIDHGQLDIIIWGYGVSVSLRQLLFFASFIFSSMDPPPTFPYRFQLLFLSSFFGIVSSKACIYSRCLVKTLNYNRSSLQRVSSFIVVGNRKRIWKEMKLKKKNKRKLYLLPVDIVSIYGEAIARRRVVSTHFAIDDVDLQWL